MNIFQYLKKKNLIDYTNKQIELINKNCGLKPINTSLLLNEGEKAFFEEEVTLRESQTTISDSRIGLSMGIGLFSITSNGKSYNKKVLEEVDFGKFIISNKRILFTGRIENRVIEFKKILSISTYLDSISISYEGNTKVTFFDVKNPYLCRVIIELIYKMPNPEDFGDDKIKITIVSS